MRLESAVGVGTTFTIALPPTVGAADARRTAGGDGRAAPQTKLAAHVMVVDDDQLVRTTAARLLARMGCRVTEASDGRDALERLATGDDPVALIVTDYAMPRMDGGALIAALRAAGNPVPVVLMSGYAEDDAHLPVDDPRVRFIHKPFSRSDFTATIHGLLHG